MIICEKCGRIATCHVVDLTETEPELGTDGVLYSKKIDDLHHDFCHKHARVPKTNKWLAPEGWRPPDGWDPNAEPVTIVPTRAKNV